MALANTIIPDTPRATTTTGIVLAVFPGFQSALVTVQSAPDVTGSAGSFTTIGTIASADLAGSAYVDLLPLDGAKRWYRTKDSYPGYNDSPWSISSSATPTVIPPNIPYDSKPWLYNGSLPLELSMNIVSMTSSSLIVTASLNADPAAQGTPTISVLNYFGVTTPSSSAFNQWTVQRPVGDTYGRVVFQNSMPGRLSATDSVYVPGTLLSSSNTITSASFLTLHMTTTTFDATKIRVSGSVDNPQSVPYNISQLSSYNISTITPISTNIWDINRPSSGVGSVTFYVSSSTANIVSDEAVVEIGQLGMYGLAVNAAAASTDSATITVNVTVYDPFNSTTTLSGITVTPSYVAQVGLTVTLNSTTSNTGNTVYNYTITRPNAGQGTAVVTFTATKTNYVPGADVIFAPEISFYPILGSYTLIASTATSVTYAITGSDALGGAGPTGSWSVHLIPTSNVTFIGSGSVVSGSGGFNYSFTTASYTITQPTGSAPAAFNYLWTKTNRQSLPLNITIPALASTGSTAITSVSAFYESSSNDTTNLISLAWVVNNPPSGSTNDIGYHQSLLDGTADDTGTVTNVTSSYDFGTDSTGTIDLVPKGTSGSSPSTHQFTLKVKNSGGSVVATASTTANHYGKYLP